MKIREDFVLKRVDDEFVIIPVGYDSFGYHGLMTINKLGVFLWNQLKTDTTVNHVVANVMETYDVDEETARRDVIFFIERMKRYQVLENV